MQQNTNGDYHLLVVMCVILIFSFYTMLFSKDSIERTYIREAIQKVGFLVFSLSGQTSQTRRDTPSLLEQIPCPTCHSH